MVVRGIEVPSTVYMSIVNGFGRSDCVLCNGRSFNRRYLHRTRRTPSNASIYSSLLLKYAKHITGYSIRLSYLKGFV
jgi:hypothetical protein